jgi:hypothetical protein
MYQCTESTRMFLVRPDPHPDPFVRGTYPMIRIRIRPYQKVTDPQH